MPDQTPQDVRPATWQDVIAAEATKQGIDPRLATAVADVESGFNPSAKSSAGAMGLMQLMPETASRLKVDPADPLQNIKGGVSELKRLLDDNGGDVTKALRLYNASPNADPSVTDPYVQKVLGKIAPASASNAPQQPSPSDAFAAELKGAIGGESATPGTPKDAPSWLSLVGTAAKTAAKDTFVAPAAALLDTATNAYTRTRAAQEAIQGGDVLEGLKQTALSNPIVRLADQMVVEPAIDQAKKTAESFGQGHYLEAAGHAAATALPVIGPAAANVGELIGTGDPEKQAEAAGHVVAAIAGPKVLKETVGRGIGAAASLLPAGDTESAATTLMARAARPGANNPGFTEKIPRALADLKAVEQATGKPIEDLGGALDAIKTAKAANRKQFDQLKDPQAAAGAVIDGTPIADAIEKSIPQRTRLQNPSEVERVQKVADSYRRDIPITEADQLLQEVNADLDSYFQKNPAAKRAQAVSNPDTAATVAEAEGLRSQFYDKLDNPGGGAAAQELQRRYGSLAELERALLKRKNATMVSGPDPLIESVGKFAAARDLVRGGAKLVGGVLSGNPALMGSAAMDAVTALTERQVSKYIAEQRTTDALIKRAMAAHQALPKPIKMPAQQGVSPTLPTAAVQAYHASGGASPVGGGWVPTPQQIASAPPSLRARLERLAQQAKQP